MDATPDTLHILGLRFECKVGVHEWEGLVTQDILVDLGIETCIERAAKTDDLADTVNYSDVVRAVDDVVTGRSHRLIESMAERIAGCVLGFDGVRAVRVRVSKPGASKVARDVAVEIVRRSPN
jgi:7,8-dihydroneopterin aldolase/epimerase/oxygenase